MMDRRLLVMAGELAQTAIDIYSCRPTFSYLAPNSDLTARRVYNELMISVKAKLPLDNLAENVAKIAVSSYCGVVCHKLPTATIHETKTLLKRLITQTNTQRKLLINEALGTID